MFGWRGKRWELREGDGEDLMNLAWEFFFFFDEWECERFEGIRRRKIPLIFLFPQIGGIRRESGSAYIKKKKN
jgi:hypothetical protein